MARVHHVKARKDYPDIGVKKGEMYYWWALKTQRGGIKRRSKTPPRPSDLTLSEFKGTLYGAQESFEDQLGAAESFADLESAREEFKGELETLRDEQSDKLSNMPEGLQQGDTGQLLQSRYDELETMISDLEGVDIPDDDDHPEPDESEPSYTCPCGWVAQTVEALEPIGEVKTDSNGRITVCPKCAEPIRTDEIVDHEEIATEREDKLSEVRDELSGIEYNGE